MAASFGCRWGRARRAAVALAPAALVAAASACEWLGGFQDFSREHPVDTPHACDEIPPSKIDSQRSTTQVLVKIEGGECFWIDKTEVTVEQYEKWLDANKGYSAWYSTHCIWKTSTNDPSRDAQDVCRASLTSEDDPWAPKKPIRCVDWCDAEAFCRTAGARLCSSYATAYAPVEVSTEQWQMACTSGSASALPWGDDACWNCCNLATGTVCPNGQGGKCQPAEVGAREKCASSTKVMDLLGNVREWVFSCKAGATAEDAKAPCRALGQSFADSWETQSCSGLGAQLPRDTRDAETGFRCCAELTPSEALLVSSE